MTLVQLHTTLRDMLPVDVRLHLQVGLQSTWCGRDPATKHPADLELQLEIDAFASLDGVSAQVDGQTPDELIERFRAVVLPALGLVTDVADVCDRLRRLDCDLAGFVEPQFPPRSAGAGG